MNIAQKLDLAGLVRHFSALVRKAEDESTRFGIKQKRQQLMMAAAARCIREHSGKSLRGVARRMGVSAMFLSDLERGNRNWNIKQIKKWKKAIK